MIFRCLKLLLNFVVFNIFHYILIINSTIINVNNEDDLINGFNNNLEDILTINIKNTNLKITNDSIIDNINKTTLKKIIINGVSKEDSILILDNSINKLIFNNENIKEIHINKLTIYGFLDFVKYQEVILENVVLYGRLNFNNYKESNKLIDISNFQYYDKLNIKTNNCIDLYGNVIINNSYFYGNPSCSDSLLSFKGENINNLQINNSYFDGAYSNNCVSISNSSKSHISSSLFEKGGSFKNGGGAIRVIKSNFYIEDCKFNDNFSIYDGGIFYVLDSYSFIAQNIEAYNSTALEKGSLIYMNSSENIKTTGYIINAVQTNSGNINKKIKGGSLIASVEGYSSLYIENFYGNELNAGNGVGAFNLNYHSSIELKNIELNGVSGSSSGGLLLTSKNEEKDSFFKVYNGTFTDFNQFSKETSSSLIMTSNNINIILENCNINNINSVGYYFIYTKGGNTIEIKNSIIENCYSEYGSDFIICESFNDIDKCIIYIYYFSDLYSCYFSSYCIPNVSYKEITFDIGVNANMNINNSILSILFADSIFKARSTSLITINNSDISNHFVTESIIYIDKNLYFDGHYIINNCNFNENISYYGCILNIQNLDSSGSSVEFNNSTFSKNYSMYNGGVIYSKVKSLYLYISFNNCIFDDNSCHYQGFISYSLSKSDEPFFSNIDELRKIENAFATPPVNLRFISNSLNSVSLLSGESLQNDIKFNLIDDYNNLYITFTEDIDYYSPIDVVFLSIETNDPFNTALIGQNLSYCTNNICHIPPVKIVGNPGFYNLIIRIHGSEEINKFDEVLFNFDLIINPCNDSRYINNDIENIGFKSCYLPECIPNCNSGVCVNKNVCDCSKTSFKGPFCNEYYKLNRYHVIDIIFKIIGCSLIIILIIIMAGLILCRENLVLKSASFSLLNIILLGLLLNCLYLLVLTYDENKVKMCILEYLLHHLSFTLVFGPIVLKTYRIYRIFGYIRIHENVKQNKIYLILYFLIAFHIFMLILWVSLKKIKIDLAYTNNLKEYKKCIYPNSKIISVLFNLILIFIGWILTYATRNAYKNYKERMNVPIYTYIVIMGLIYFLGLEKEINVFMLNIFKSIGAIIEIVITVYYIFITKFYTMYINHINEKGNTSKSSLRL
ncbi:7 transmembrane sweet-taste receptor of 3 GCPR-domain-containing protein [Neocallimastix sp. 'constans']